jgi:hypothetical protein
MRGTMKTRILIAALAGPALAGCVPSVSTPPPVQAGLPAPATYPTAGLESVLGRSASALVAQFGTPELDVREGNARMLQFSAAACVLDAYLYPPRGGGEPVVTHIDARLPDGRDIDRSSCVAALGHRRR